MFRHEFMTHSTFKANEVPMKGWKDCVTKKGKSKVKMLHICRPHENINCQHKYRIQTAVTELHCD